jgi:hypothetical protein
MLAHSFNLPHMPAPQRCPTNLRHWLNLTIADVPVRKLLANYNGNDNGNDAGGTGSFGAWDIHSTDCNLTKNASTGDYVDHDLQGYIDRLTNITLQLRRTKAARAYISLWHALSESGPAVPHAVATETITQSHRPTGFCAPIVVRSAPLALQATASWSLC